MTKANKVTRDNLGAWMLKCNPQTWDLEGFLAEGNEFIENWSVQDNYRSELMREGDLVLFWVTAGNPHLQSGIWGVGRVAEEPQWVAVQADDEGGAGYWIDEEARLARQYFVGVDLAVSELRLSREDILAVPNLSQLEVLVQAQMGNPLYVSKQEAEILLDMVGGAPDPVGTDAVLLDNRGATFATDPIHRVVVEWQAMGKVEEAYTAAGWTCEDVSAAKVGWDITARRAGAERHIEVKGLSGRRPTILITANEYAAAEHDPDWCLAVVTEALSDPQMHEYSRADVRMVAKPYVFKADLSGLSEVVDD